MSGSNEKQRKKQGAKIPIRGKNNIRQERGVAQISDERVGGCKKG